MKFLSISFLYMLALVLNELLFITFYILFTLQNQMIMLLGQNVLHNILNRIVSTIKSIFLVCLHFYFDDNFKNKGNSKLLITSTFQSTNWQKIRSTIWQQIHFWLSSCHCVVVLVHQLKTACVPEKWMYCYKWTTT